MICRLWFLRPLWVPEMKMSIKIRLDCQVGNFSTFSSLPSICTEHHFRKAISCCCCPLASWSHPYSCFLVFLVDVKNLTRLLDPGAIFFSSSYVCRFHTLWDFSTRVVKRHFGSGRIVEFCFQLNDVPKMGWMNILIESLIVDSSREHKIGKYTEGK